MADFIKQRTSEPLGWSVQHWLIANYVWTMLRVYVYCRHTPPLVHFANRRIESIEYSNVKYSILIWIEMN